MTTIKINDIEFEYNRLDAIKVETAETALQKVLTETEMLAKDDTLKLSQLIRKTCIAVFECFNSIFGDGTDKKIFGESCDMGKALDAFWQLSSQIGEEATVGDINALSAKYMPNRATRRATK